MRENKPGGNQSSNFMLDGNGNAYWVMDQDAGPRRRAVCSARPTRR